ncbi:hypothetical protein TNCV_2160671 [Trichonephila clavipes]|nr:hypothetical protein TNCV_2160671 [Trichonephila clavipes]
MQTLFPAGDGIFQDDNAPIYATGLSQSWFDEHEDKVRHLLWRDLTVTQPQCDLADRGNFQERFEQSMDGEAIELDMK